MVSISKKKSGQNSYPTERVPLRFVESTLFRNSSEKVSQIEKNQPQQEISIPLWSIETPTLSILQRLMLRLGFIITIGMKQPENYEPIEFFLRRCRKHGVIVTYPQGYLGKFRCNKCLQERRKNSEHGL